MVASKCDVVEVGVWVGWLQVQLFELSHCGGVGDVEGVTCAVTLNGQAYRCVCVRVAVGIGEVLEGHGIPTALLLACTSLRGRANVVSGVPWSCVRGGVLETDMGSAGLGNPGLWIPCLLHVKLRIASANLM